MTHLNRIGVIAAAIVLATYLAASIGSAGENEIVEGFSEHLLADGYGYAFAVMAGDIDRDGDLDLTSGDATDNFLYWYENDGEGHFTRHFIQKDDPGWFERHDLGDIDGDGDLDIAIVKNQVGELFWFENSGQPREEKLWTKHAISTDFKRAYDIALKDIDGDGDLDAAASNYVSQQVVWFENPGKFPSQAEWTRHVIDEQLGETRTIRFADFNADGLIDVFTTTRTTNLVVWFENPGKSTDKPWKRTVVDDKTSQPVHGQAVDLDRDGDPDIIVGAGMLADVRHEDSHEVNWYENVGAPGTGIEWKEHRLARFPFAFEAHAGDLDGDGDLDIAATAFGGNGGIAWLENSGDPAGKWIQHILKPTWPKANQVIIVDLNGDQKLDIVASCERDSNEIRWWRNEMKSKK